MTKGAQYNRAEELQARKDGAELVKNSGRGMRKGDARLNGKYLLDYKFTDGKSYSINLDKFKDFEKQAWAERLNPIIVAIFRSYGDKGLAILPWEDLKEIIRELESLRACIR